MFCNYFLHIVCFQVLLVQNTFTTQTIDQIILAAQETSQPDYIGEKWKGYSGDFLLQNFILSNKMYNIVEIYNGSNINNPQQKYTVTHKGI